MALDTLMAALLDLPNESAVQDYLAEHRSELSPQILERLSQRAEHLQRKNPREALWAANVLLHASNCLGEDRAQATALRIKGTCLMFLGQYQASIACYAQAQEIRARYGERLELARLQIGWVAALKNLARYDEALQMGLETGQVLGAYEQWGWLAKLEMNLGSIYRLTDRRAEALAIYEQSLEHFRRAQDPVGAAQVQVNMVRLLSCQDRHQDALRLLGKVRPILEECKEWLTLARADLNLATLSFQLGRYHKAWEYYKRAREGFERLGNEMEASIVDLYHSQVYLDLNLFPEALELAQNAQPILERLGLERYVALAQFHQASARWGLGEAQAALELFQQARDFFVTHQGKSWAALVDLDRIALLRATGRPAEALGVAQQAAEVFAQEKMTIRLAQTRLLMAECYIDYGQPALAQSLCQAVLDLPPEQCLPTLAYRASYGLGRVAEMQGQAEHAHTHYQAAFQAIETIRQTLRVDEFKASFLEDKLAVYQALVRQSLEMGRWEQALDYVERSKSSALLDLLSRQVELRAASEPGINAEAWERLRRLKEEWRWRQAKLDRLRKAGDEEESSRAARSDETVCSELQSVEREIIQVLRQIQTSRCGALFGDNGRFWRNAQEGLAKDAALIEYFCMGDRVLAFVLTQQGVQACEELPYSLREIKRSLGALELALKGACGLAAEYVDSVLKPMAQRHLSWLYTVLIAPLAAWIGQYRTLIIAPDDALYYLPFHALQVESACLLDKHTIHYVPSAGILGLCSQTQMTLARGEELTALIMGYSDRGRLRHVCDEARAVAAAVSNPLLFQEEEATLDKVTQHAEHCRLIHLASHGAFRADSPLFSSLSLADEPLNVIDIYHLRLNAALVTLSACETGVGRLRGDDLFGLVRGCLHAGAPSLVVSLWRVDDASTTLLMSDFYKRLASGESIANALRGAQQALRQVERVVQGKRIRPYEHPYYWAPFFLIGADGRV